MDYFQPLELKVSMKEAVWEEEQSFVSSMSASFISSETDASRLTFNFREASLYGRSKEVELLRAAYRRAYDGSSEFMFIRGRSGSGKTKLVEDGLREYVSEGDGGYFIVGKYDSLHNEPYSAFVAALTQLVDLILESDEAEAKQKELDLVLTSSEIQELSQVIVNLPRLSGNRSMQRRQAVSMNRASKRFFLLCCSLLNTLLSSAHPALLFLDDVHWMDEDSLALLKAIAEQKPASKHLLIVCATRRLERSEDIVLDDASIPTSEIVLDGISDDEITKVVSDLLHRNIEETKPLIEEVARRTCGNFFHINQFLDVLSANGQIARSRKGFIFDLETIKKEDVISNGTNGLLEKKVDRLEKDAQEVLKVAACLGYRFRVDILVHICRSLSDENESWEAANRRVKRVLDKAGHVGFTERFAWQGQLYGSFIHDRMQQCWYKIIMAERDVKAYHLQIGQLILYQMQTDQDESLLFLAADNVRRGLTRFEGEPTVAELDLFLQASREAAAKFAFIQANSYAQAGVWLLKKSTHHWDRWYRLSVNIFSTKIEIETALGNFTRARTLAEEILANSTSSDDTMKANLMILESLGDEGLFDEALLHGFNILKQLDQTVPQSHVNAHLAKEIIVAKQALRRLTDSDLLSLPMASNKAKSMAMKVMSIMGIYAHLNENLSLAFMLCLRQMRLTVKNGLCDASCYAFASHGMFHAFYENNQEASRYAGLAFKLMEKTEAQRYENSAHGIMQRYILHVKQPWVETREALLKQYPRAIELGDLPAAFHIAQDLIVAVTVSDTTLTVVQKEISRYLKLMTEYGKVSLYSANVSASQRVLNLMVPVDDPSILTGSLMKEETLLTELESCGNVFGLQTVYHQKIELALLFESWDMLASLLPKFEKREKVLATHLSQYSAWFGVALSYFALHRTTRKGKYLRGATRVTKMFKKWAEDGMKDCEPIVTFLEAEVSLGADNDNAPMLFVQASRGLSDSGWFMNYQALAYERAGYFYLSRNDEKAAHDHFSVALSKYESWKAYAKVQALNIALEQFPLFQQGFDSKQLGLLGSESSGSRRARERIECQDSYRNFGSSAVESAATGNESCSSVSQESPL